MKQINLFIIFLHVLTFVSAQNSSITNTNFIPPSPEAASLLRYVSVPVNHSTGVPDIKIPIYNFKEGSLEVPISISYHAGGIRVRDIASVVGLGWSLNAGGLISRSVIGKSDEVAFLPPYKSFAELTAAINSATESQRVTLASHLNQMEQHFSEFMTDRYGFNFLGYSGTFRNVKSASGEELIYTLPYKPFRIEKKYEAGTLPQYQRLYYQITDDKGIQYEFKKSETTEGPITGWRLAKITSPDLSDEIRFYYSGLETIFQAINNPSVEAGDNPVVIGSSNYWVRVVEHKLAPRGGFNSDVQQLDSIVSKSGAVRFFYLKDRYDGRTTRLQKITVEGGNQTLRNVEFVQSYFGSAQNHTARMKLDNVLIKNDVGSTVEQYGFGYNTLWDLPGYYYTPNYQIPQKIQEDYWGFWNGSGGGGLPREFLTFLTPNEANVYAGNRNPVSGSMDAYILQEIRYPTGGKTVYQFECNQTPDPYFYGYANTNNGIVGGLRVKTIRSYSANNTLAGTKTFEYNAIGTFQPIQSNLFQYEYTIRYFNELKPPPHLDKPQGLSVFRGATASSNYPLGVFDSCPLSYSVVTEYEGSVENNAGKTVYYYLVPENPSQGSSGSLLPPWQIGAFQSDKGDPVSLLSKVEKYRKDGTNYKKVSVKENIYAKSAEFQFITGMSLYQDPILIHNQQGRWREPVPSETYAQYLQTFKFEDLVAHQFMRTLSSSRDSVFFDGQPAVVSSTDYQYNNFNSLLAAGNSLLAVNERPLRKTSTYSGGDVKITTYTYPKNYTTAPYNSMLQKNMLSPVIEEKEYLGSTTNKPIAGVKVDYALWNGNSNQIYPSSEYVYRRDMDGYELQKTFLGYDSNGNLKGFSESRSAPTAILWGYHGQYPIAIATNATSNDIAFTGFEYGDSGNWSWNGQVYSGSSSSHDGRNFLGLNAGQWLSKNGLNSSKKYRVSIWIWNTVNPGNGFVAVITKGNWTKYEKVISGTTSFVYTASGTEMLDNVSLCPIESMMETYTYMPKVGLLSKTDSKGQTEYFEYDGSGRLSSIKDEEGNIINGYRYNYKH